MATCERMVFDFNWLLQKQLLFVIMEAVGDQQHTSLLPLHWTRLTGGTEEAHIFHLTGGAI